MALVALWVSILLSCAALIQYTGAQKCVPAEKGLDVTEQAYRTMIVLKAKVTKQGKVNHTAQVTEVFPTRNGGLAKSSVIVFGPVKKGKGCTRIKKNSEYILFLELADPSSSNFHRIKFDPVSKLSQAKKLKKLLCKGCVKAPKISGKSKSLNIKENGKFTFKCKASGNPKPIASFIKDGETLPKKPKGMKIKIKKKGGGGKLVINKVKKEHEGLYICNVMSFVGNASLSMSLTVLKDDCVECPPTSADYCVHGRCCFVEVVNQTACRCQPGFSGKRCRNPIISVEVKKGERNTIEARYHQQTIAIMAVCIALLLVVLICYIVYCKFKKSRSHIRKEIINRNGLVSARPNEGVIDRPLTDASNAGILGDDAANRGIEMTGYRSTNLTSSVNQSPHPTAFAQRPQTYDDVILAQAAEELPLMHSARSSRKQEEKQSRHGASGRRRRKNGVAVGHSDDHSRSASDIEGPKAPRRIDEIKSGHDSLTSSASSLASHELRKPNIPLDERTANMMALSGVRRPPDYPVDPCDDEPDTGELQPHSSHQPSTTAQISPEAQRPLHTQFMHEPPLTTVSQECIPSTPSSISAHHRVTAFDSDGRVEEERMGRDEGTLQGVIPHSPNRSPDFSQQFLPKSELNLQSPSLASPSTDRGQMIPRPKLLHQNKNIGGIYPYYEHNPECVRSPSSHHDSDDIPETYLQMYDNQMCSQPSSPRQYQTSPGMGMEVPYRHAPVTIASARTHHLPLLTKEQPVVRSVDAEPRFLADSMVSLSSSSSNRSSLGTERNRNSHKIEV